MPQSKRWIRHLASVLENEVRNPMMQNPHTQPVLSPVTTQSKDDEFWPLSEKPYFHVVLTKSHVKPSYHMFFPTRMEAVLPSTTVPVVITYRGKNWKTKYYGELSRKRFDISWKNFLIDNDLKVGDALVLELMESSSANLKFRVQILRGDIPDELLARVNGENSDTPIIVD